MAPARASKGVRARAALPEEDERRPQGVGLGLPGANDEVGVGQGVEHGLAGRQVQPEGVGDGGEGQRLVAAGQQPQDADDTFGGWRASGHAAEGIAPTRWPGRGISHERYGYCRMEAGARVGPGIDPADPEPMPFQLARRTSATRWTRAATLCSRGGAPGRLRSGSGPIPRPAGQSAECRRPGDRASGRGESGGGQHGVGACRRRLAQCRGRALPARPASRPTCCASMPWSGEPPPRALPASPPIRTSWHQRSWLASGPTTIRSPADFAQHVDQMMALLGNRQVLWVNLARSGYGALNAVLAAATSHYPNLQLVDWATAYAAHPKDQAGRRHPRHRRGLPAQSRDHRQCPGRAGPDHRTLNQTHPSPPVL